MTGSFVKISAQIDYPTTADFGPFVTKSTKDNEDTEDGKNDDETPRESSKYRLFGVCTHSGTLSGGHYTAYTKINGTDGIGFLSFLSHVFQNGTIIPICITTNLLCLRPSIPTLM
jgi:ubiquitin C-terminal hydrolase